MPERPRNGCSGCELARSITVRRHCQSCWVHVIRFLPAAFLFLWPVVRIIPRELLEAARLDGAGPARELLFVVWPMAWPATGIIAVAVTALALGEHEAAGRVATPMWESFAKLLFDRMHYGAEADVAALSLLLLADWRHRGRRRC